MNTHDLRVLTKLLAQFQKTIASNNDSFSRQLSSVKNARQRKDVLAYFLRRMTVKGLMIQGYRLSFRTNLDGSRLLSTDMSNEIDSGTRSCLLGRDLVAPWGYQSALAAQVGVPRRRQNGCTHKYVVMLYRLSDGEYIPDSDPHHCHTDAEVDAFLTRWKRRGLQDADIFDCRKSDLKVIPHLTSKQKKGTNSHVLRTMQERKGKP